MSVDFFGANCCTSLAFLPRSFMHSRFPEIQNSPCLQCPYLLKSTHIHLHGITTCSHTFKSRRAGKFFGINLQHWYVRIKYQYVNIDTTPSLWTGYSMQFSMNTIGRRLVAWEKVLLQFACYPQLVRIEKKNHIFRPPQAACSNRAELNYPEPTAKDARRPTTDDANQQSAKEEPIERSVLARHRGNGKKRFLNGVICFLGKIFPRFRPGLADDGAQSRIEA